MGVVTPCGHREDGNAPPRRSHTLVFGCRMLIRVRHRRDDYGALRLGSIQERATIERVEAAGLASEDVSNERGSQRRRPYFLGFPHSVTGEIADRAMTAIYRCWLTHQAA